MRPKLMNTQQPLFLVESLEFLSLLLHLWHSLHFENSISFQRWLPMDNEVSWIFSWEMTLQRWHLLLNSIKSVQSESTDWVLFFLWPHLWHMEIPRPGVKSELQLSPYASAKQHQILAASVTYSAACCNARSSTHWARAKDPIHILTETMSGTQW